MSQRNKVEAQLCRVSQGADKNGQPRNCVSRHKREELKSDVLYQSSNSQISKSFSWKKLYNIEENTKSCESDMLRKEIHMKSSTIISK